MKLLSDTLTKALQVSKAAHRHICDLAAGKQKFQMSIPPQPYDSDMTLQSPLDMLELLTQVCREQAEALQYAKGQLLHAGYIKNAVPAIEAIEERIAKLIQGSGM